MTQLSETKLKFYAKSKTNGGHVAGEVSAMAQELLEARRLLAAEGRELIYQCMDDGHWYDTEKRLYDEVMENGGNCRVLTAAPPAPVAQPVQVPWDVRCCPECGSKLMTWDATVINKTGVPQGRLRTSEVAGLLYLGCDECSETVARVRMDEVTAFLNACRAAMLSAAPQTGGE